MTHNSLCSCYISTKLITLHGIQPSHTKTQKQHLAHILTHEFDHHYHLIFPKPAYRSKFTPRSPSPPFSYSRTTLSCLNSLQTSNLPNPPFPMRTESTWRCGHHPTLLSYQRKLNYCGCLSKMLHIIQHN